MVGRKERRKKRNAASSAGATLGFETKLFAAADKLRNNLDAAEYKHVILGLIFLKYISDDFEEQKAKLTAQEPTLANDPEAYRTAQIVWVPENARWAYLEAHCGQPKIGELVDAAMQVIEAENRPLRGVLSQNYARATLDKRQLGELVALVGTIGLGGEENRSQDTLGRVYEYFLGRFARAEGQKGGQFYTPRCVVQLLVEMLAPRRGSVYDPCCGSGGMFVQSKTFVEKHGGERGDLNIYGQESNPTTWRLARMNLAIRGIDGDLGSTHADTLSQNAHSDLKVDYVMANPPFNSKDWGRERLENDPRWRFGTPPANNANFAWVQHFVHHLAPTGVAGFVLANGSLSSTTGGEDKIRQAIVDANLLDCVVALPGGLFYSTPIPACLWFLAKNKSARRVSDQGISDHDTSKQCDHTLFIDAREFGSLVDRTHRAVTDDEVRRIAGVYHAWHGAAGAGAYEDVAGFCKSVPLAEIAANAYVLTPGRFVGTRLDDRDDAPLEVELPRLTKVLAQQFKESARLEKRIRAQLKEMGHGL